MPAPATAPALYEIFQIISSDGQRKVDLYEAQFRVTSFDIFENILSPYITGRVSITSSGAAAKDEERNRMTSLRSGLPLETGCMLKVKIKPQLGKTIDYSRPIDAYKVLYVDKVSTAKDSTSEILELSFTSHIAILNDTNRVLERFNNRISASVKKIIENYLELDSSKINITETSNSASFSGNQKRPLDLIIDMASRSVPAKTANPGFLCYETIDKFNFVSFDELINRESDFEYNYNGVLIATEQLRDESNNFKVADMRIEKDQDLLKQIRSGVYSSKSIFFNSLTYGFTEIDISVVDGKLSEDPNFASLGEKYKVPSILEKGFKGSKKIHRINTAVIDIGAEKENISVNDKNNDPEVYIAAVATRYNLMFSQKISVTVPCNTDISAGSNIKLIVEDSSENKEQGPDRVRSGKYIVQALRHHFDGERSVTSMMLIRDSYGLHFTKTI
jgi:hypothetical protein